MGLIDRIKSLLGMGGDATRHRGREDTTVSVEHDPAAGGGRGDEQTSDPASGTPGEDNGGPPATDAVGGDDADTSGADGRTEAGSEATADAGDGTPTDDESETDAGPGAGTDDAAPGAGDPVDTIEGVGPAYSERLAAAGVETTGDLAAADAADLADRTDIAASRVERWIERADE